MHVEASHAQAFFTQCSLGAEPERTRPAPGWMSAEQHLFVHKVCHPEMRRPQSLTRVFQSVTRVRTLVEPPSRLGFASKISTSVIWWTRPLASVIEIVPANADKASTTSSREAFAPRARSSLQASPRQRLASWEMTCLLPSLSRAARIEMRCAQGAVQAAA